MNGNRIIVHTLITIDGKFLVTKRSANETTYPNYWDIPGGLVEMGEMPRDALIRETKEEVNLNIIPTKIIHEDSNYDKIKNMIFIRLVYLCVLVSDIKEIFIDVNEHSEYKLISDLSQIENDLVSPFLIEVFDNIK